jgi:hypothetical protein
MGKKKPIQITSAGSTLTKEPERRGTPEHLQTQQKQVLNIIELIGNKGLPMVKAAKEVGMNQTTFLDYIEKDNRLIELYARAIDQRNDLKAERIIKLANKRDRDMYIDQNGHARPNPVAVQRDRLIIDAEKWLLSKLAPKKYGDRIQIDAEVKSSAPLNMDQVNQILAELDKGTIDISHSEQG